ncbi:MAG: arginine N-succinyltransferase [Pseudomonadota bacterium]
MNTETISSEDAPTRRGFSLKQVLLIVLVTLLLAVAGTYLFVTQYLFQKEFTPVELNEKERSRLNDKLRAIGVDPEGLSGEASPSTVERTPNGNVVPEKYSESASDREIHFSEKELNALLANNSDLSKRMAIDLSDDLASAKWIIPTDPDFPLIGGKTIRINTGLGLSFADARPKVILRGVSIMGVPLPNAWLGNLKNVDLVGEFGMDGGFWESFAAGIEFIQVREGQLQIKLKE